MQAKFARRDYEFVARHIHERMDEYLEIPDPRTDAMYTLAQSFADSYESDNELFNRIRFLKACGVLY